MYTKKKKKNSLYPRPQKKIAYPDLISLLMHACARMLQTSLLPQRRKEKEKKRENPHDLTTSYKISSP